MRSPNEVRGNNRLNAVIEDTLITSKSFLEYVQNNAGGSAQPQANPPLLGEYELIIPNRERMNDFNKTVAIFLNTIESNETEIIKLKEISTTVITMISSR